MRDVMLNEEAHSTVQLMNRRLRQAPDDGIVLDPVLDRRLATGLRGIMSTSRVPI